MEEHDGQTQEILFRVVGHFRTPLERQVWESVEIDATTMSLGARKCLNSRTEWESFKDPVLLTQDATKQKTLASQKEKKRARVQQIPDLGISEELGHPRPNKKARLPNTVEDTTATPVRSRWQKWQKQRMSPTQHTQSTGSGLQGPQDRPGRQESPSATRYPHREGRVLVRK